MPDVHRDGIVVLGVILVLPDEVEQLLGADHLALSLAQDAEDGELRGGQVQELLVQEAFVGLHVQGKAGYLQDVILLQARVVPFVPAQLGLHPGHQLQRQEGLGYIVVRAHGKAGNLVRLLPLGRQHDDGVVVALPDPAADVQAACPGQHDVQDSKVWPLLFHDVHGLGPVIAFDDLVALVLQVQGHQVRNLLLVVRH